MNFQSPHLYHLTIRKPLLKAHNTPGTPELSYRGFNFGYDEILARVPSSGYVLANIQFT